MANIVAADLIEKADALRVFFQAMQSRPEKLVSKRSLISQACMSVVAVCVVPEAVQSYMNEVSSSISHTDNPNRIDLWSMAKGL
jgi:hypothetical protein